MKQFFLPFLTLLGIFYLTAPDAMAQKVDAGDVMNIALKGDANTEQSAKLELIRILEERMNKLTVAQMNARVIVSTGVKNYYKVAELNKMFDQMWSLRVIVVGEIKALEVNPGFGEAGNNFAWTYLKPLNEDITTVDLLKKQLKTLVTDGKPIQLPAMPTFSISPPASVDDMAVNFGQTMQGIMAQYGIKDQSDLDKLTDAQRAAMQAQVDAAKAEFEKQFKAMVSATNKQTLTVVGNIVGTLVGVPGAGTLLAGVASGGSVAAAASGLVGSIVDKFVVPDEYFDSPTLKLTDAERLKMIDELHSRMAEILQKDIALRANMNSEVKKRYSNISQSRNETILYGPKK